MFGKMLAVAAAGAVAYGVGKALTVKQRTWAVACNGSGYHLWLMEIPAWALLADNALQVFPCTCNMPGWTFRVGPRRFGVYDDGSGEPVRSLGSAGYALCAARHSITTRVERVIERRVPLTRDQAAKLSPSLVAVFDEDDDEFRSGPADYTGDAVIL